MPWSQPALALTPDSEAAPAQGAQPLSPSELPSVSSASQGHSLTISILSASRRESWQLNHRKTSSPSGAGDKEGCINPRALQKCSQCSGSSRSLVTASINCPPQSLSVDTQALGGWVVCGIHLPLLDIQEHRDPDCQAVRNFSSAHDVSPQ